MKERHLTIPEIVLIAGTRVVLGLGLGLLFADRLTGDQRRAVGWALFAVGALSTIPLAAEVLGRGRPSASAPLHVPPNAVSP
jgi:hypothetical protein